MFDLIVLFLDDECVAPYFRLLLDVGKSYGCGGGHKEKDNT